VLRCNRRMSNSRLRYCCSFGVSGGPRRPSSFIGVTADNIRYWTFAPFGRSVPMFRPSMTSVSGLGTATTFAIWRYGHAYQCGPLTGRCGSTQKRNRADNNPAVPNERPQQRWRSLVGSLNNQHVVVTRHLAHSANYLNMKNRKNILR